MWQTLLDAFGGELFLAEFDDVGSDHVIFKVLEGERIVVFETMVSDVLYRLFYPIHYYYTQNS